jgi:TatD DNase family protein
MIDTHCHLTFDDFAPPMCSGGVPGVLARAKQHGVTGCITISTTTVDCEAALALAKAHDNVWCTSGVHPLYSDEAPHVWSRMGEVARDAKCVAWGELGLDKHYEHPPFALQRQVLDEQLAFIKGWHSEAGRVLPIVLHCREAFEDLCPVLRDSGLDCTRMVFHCFTASDREMRLLLDLGSMVSFTGVATYTNARELHKAIALAPPERIMIETDAPFLSPHPHRSTRPCEPWMASITAGVIAQRKGMALPAFLRTINANTERFFGIRVPEVDAAQVERGHP